jgi:hypothetical protein
MHSRPCRHGNGLFHGGKALLIEELHWCTEHAWICDLVWQAVLFVDISGFTALSEKLQNQDARHGVERLKVGV